jgi:hypothetical protein
MAICDDNDSCLRKFCGRPATATGRTAVVTARILAIAVQAQAMRSGPNACAASSASMCWLRPRRPALEKERLAVGRETAKQLTGCAKTFDRLPLNTGTEHGARSRWISIRHPAATSCRR